VGFVGEGVGPKKTPKKGGTKRFGPGKKKTGGWGGGGGGGGGGAPLGGGGHLTLSKVFKKVFDLFLAVPGNNSDKLQAFFFLDPQKKKKVEAFF